MVSPITIFEANASWTMVVAMSADLVCWFQVPCFDGHRIHVRPQKMRRGTFHPPGCLIRRLRQRVIRSIDGWTGTDALLDAYKRIAIIA